MMGRTGAHNVAGCDGVGEGRGGRSWCGNIRPLQFVGLGPVRIGKEKLGQDRD